VAHKLVYSSVAAAALALVLTAGPGRAAVFAEFTPDSPGANYMWRQSGGAGDEGAFYSVMGGFSPGAVGAAVHFSFLDPSLSALAFLPATFLLSSAVTTSTPATTGVDGSLTQGNVGGSFSFTYAGPTQTIGSITLTHNATNLLSGVFTSAFIKGLGSTLSGNMSSSPGALTFTSDVESFTKTVPGSQAFMFDLLSAQFAASPGKSLATLTAHGGGRFSFLTGDTKEPKSGVPEPATWGLMITGFGMVGGLTRAAAHGGRLRAALTAGVPVTAEG
jgi:hypothetical protein